MKIVRQHSLVWLTAVQGVAFSDITSWRAEWWAWNI